MFEFLIYATLLLSSTTSVKNSVLFGANMPTYSLHQLAKVCFPIERKWRTSLPQYNRRADLLLGVSGLESLKFNKAFLSQRAFQKKSQTEDISSVPVRLTVAMGTGRGAVLRHSMISSQSSSCWDASAC